MKSSFSIIAAAMVGLFATLPAYGQGGSLTPPPGAPAPNMHSLQELWEKLETIEAQNQALWTKVDNLQQQMGGMQGQFTLLHTDIADVRRIGLDISSLTVRLADFLHILPWSITMVDDGIERSQCSLAFGPDGYPAISYLNELGLGSLMFARYNGTTWQISVVDDPPVFGDVAGFQNSLAFSPSGAPTISYFGSGALKVASFNGTAWSFSIIETLSQSAMHTSLKFTPSGQPAVSYLDVSGNPTLKYAVFNGFGWTITPVATLGQSANFWRDNNVPLAFNPAGNPTIAFYDPASGGSLKLAVYDGVSSWTISTVDATPNVGQYCSLVYTPAGRPAISYFDEANDDLKFAEFNGIAWIRTVVDSTGDVGRYTSLAYTPGGQPAIAYKDFTNGGFKYTVFNGTAWTFGSVDTESGPGYELQLAFTPDGEPAVAYTAQGQDIKYAVRTPFIRF